MLGDLVEVLHLHFGVPVLFWVKHDVGTFLASTEAHIGLHLDIGQPFIVDPFLQFRHELLRATRFTIYILANETHSTHGDFSFCSTYSGANGDARSRRPDKSIRL